MKKLYSHGLAILTLLTSNVLLAQNNQKLKEIAQETSYNKNNQIDFVKLKNSTSIYESNAEAFLSSSVLDEGVKAKKYKTEIDKLGFTHTKYQLFYNSTLINNAVIIVHSQNGKIVSVNGDVNAIQKPVNSVVINEAKALQLALQKVNAKKYKWENKDEETFMKKSLNKPDFTYYPKGELVLYSKENNTSSAVHYAFKFKIYADAPLYAANVIVDAQTGAILAEENLICTADAPSTANTKYSGVQSFTTDMVSAGNYRLRETGRGLGIETYNLNNTTTYTNTDFTYTSNIWPNTAPVQTGEDAHWGAEMTYDYYKLNHGRNSIDNAGYKLLSYVHYSTNYNNAFWNGSYMTYGDGNGTLFTILTALDVCGHEITHGLTNFTAGLNGGGTGEADALNEGFSDIFGTTIENFARPSNWDWKIGADITPSGAGLRNMSNPNILGQPDTYLGTNWDFSGEPHNNNGPSIFWYYLLCQGGTGVNDISNSYTVTGLGMATAAKIAFRALTVYFVPSTNYMAARNYAIQAATDLYGICSNEVKQTTNAWYAVGVGPAYSSTVASNFNASSTSFCAVPVNITFNNTTAGGMTYQWNFGDGSAVSTATNPVHTYTASGTYAVKLKSLGCLSSTDSITKPAYITISTPANPTTTGASRCGTGTVSLGATGGPQLYWYATPTPTGVPLTIGTNYVTPSIGSNTTYYVVNTATNAAVFGAPTSSASGTGSNYTTATAYDYFDVYQPCTLRSVIAYASVAGNRTIELRNSANAIITSTVINMVVGANTLNLNFALPVATGLRLGLNSASAVNLFRTNSGGPAYPLNIGGLLDIQGTSAATAGYFYFYYNWQVQKDACTSAAIPVTATVSPGPALAVNSSTICNGQSTNLTVSGATTYSWSSGQTTSVISVTPGTTTSYTVYGTTSSCTSSSITSVVVNPNPTVTVNSAVICNGQSTNLTASGAATYSWSSGQTTSSISVSPASNTSYTITGYNGTCSNAQVSNVTVNPLPFVSASTPTAIICSGQTITIYASGASTYTWNTGPIASSILVAPPVNTTYTVTGTSAAGCDNISVVTITVNATPTVSVNSATMCSGQTTTLIANGATSYTFNPGAIVGNSIAFSPTVTTTYTVDGGTGNCFGSSTSIITVNVCTGVQEIPSNAPETISVFPNPADDYIIIYNTVTTNVVTINVYDVTGKLITTKNGDFYKEYIDVSKFAKGLYFVEIMNGTTRIYKTKIVKQ